MVDAKGSKNLSDLGACSAFIDQVVRVANMTELSRFRVELPSGLPTGPGISIVVSIIESHVAIHTWPERGTLLFNIVSCQTFNTQVVTNLLRSTFEASITRKLVVPRVA